MQTRSLQRRLNNNKQAAIGINYYRSTGAFTATSAHIETKSFQRDPS